MRQKFSILAIAAAFGMTATVLAAPPSNRSGNRGVNNVGNSKPAIKVAPKVNKPAQPINLGKIKIDPKVLKPIDLSNGNKVVLPQVDKKDTFKPLILEPKGKLAGLPGLKLPGDAKINPADLAKIKPVLDANHLKAGDLGKLKPPVDFAPKKIGLDKLKIPDNAPVVDKFNPELILKNKDKFIVNKNFCATGDYHLKCGKKFGLGWCYPGIQHCHWHHCIWDPYYGCNYFYCPSTCCYYYWSAAHLCYYPCWWFVDHGNCYYPWWLCGDAGFHIHGSGFNLHIGF
jgi:hypothetical protein